MIDENKVFERFKEKFETMSKQEQIKYLKEMGFELEEEKNKSMAYQIAFEKMPTRKCAIRPYGVRKRPSYSNPIRAGRLITAQIKQKNG